MITSLTNDKVKYVEKLKKKSSFRRSEECFVVEGIRMIREVPEELRSVLFLTEDALRQYPDLSDWCGTVETVTEQVLKRLSDTETPQGMLAVVHFPEKKTDASKEALYLVLDGLQDPGNVGTLLRTAEAVGVTEVLLSRDTADPFSPKVVRSTMGAIFRVPVRIAESLPEELRTMKKEGVRVLGTHLSGQDFYSTDLTGPVAVLVGNEGNGLTEAVTAEADVLVRIPMEGKIESLNAAVSGSVVCYEVYRQRNLR